MALAADESHTLWERDFFDPLLRGIPDSQTLLKQAFKSSGCPTEFAKIGPVTRLPHLRWCAPSRWASCGMTGTGAFDFAVFRIADCITPHGSSDVQRAGELLHPARAQKIPT